MRQERKQKRDYKPCSTCTRRIDDLYMGQNNKSPRTFGDRSIFLPVKDPAVINRRKQWTEKKCKKKTGDKQWL